MFEDSIKYRDAQTLVLSFGVLSFFAFANNSGNDFLAFATNSRTFFLRLLFFNMYIAMCISTYV